jgi:hypothetical protein
VISLFIPCYALN